MDGVKGLLASKTVWGGILVVFASILGFFGYELGGTEQQALIEHGAAIAAGVGGIIAIWGRMMATKKIKK